MAQIGMYVAATDFVFKPYHSLFTRILGNDNLFKGLKLVGDYLEKNILKPNNINYPLSRLEFLNQFRN